MTMSKLMYSNPISIKIPINWANTLTDHPMLKSPPTRLKQKLWNLSGFFNLLTMLTLMYLLPSQITHHSANALVTNGKAQKSMTIPILM